MKTIKVIGLRTSFGKHTTLKKEFGDEEHFENWVKAVERRGGKLIGYTTII